jgi:hypothetical protein
MISSKLPADAPWSTVARLVFWNRQVELESWRDGIRAGNRSYLPDSVRWMQSRHFLRFLGKEVFAAEWPVIRHHLPAYHPGKAMLDIHWSRITTGTFDADPDSVLISLPGRSRQAYNYLVRHQGASVYELSRGAGIPYRRAHDHVTRLTEAGLLSSRYEEDGPRKKRLLFTMKAQGRSVPSEMLAATK